MNSNATLLSLLVLTGYASTAYSEYIPEFAVKNRERAEQLRASKKEMLLRIFDELGAPIQAASALVVLRDIKSYQTSDLKLSSDEQGLVTCKANPYFFFEFAEIDLGEQDHHIGRQAYNFRVSDSDFIKYDLIQQSLDLTLPSVRKPIPLKAKAESVAMRRVNHHNDPQPQDPQLPDLAVLEFGYDAELLEPVEPLGRGKHADFTVTFTCMFRGFKDDLAKRHAEVDAERGLFTFDEGKVRYGNWSYTLHFRLNDKHDGIMLSPQFWPYCKLTMPHKAPEDGYTSEATLKEDQDNSGRRRDLAHCREKMENNGLFLRIRTQVDKDGNVVSANYAKIVSPMGPHGTFLIFYNPTPNDRNLEYDCKTNLRWKELHPLSKEPPPVNSPYDVRSN